MGLALLLGFLYSLRAQENIRHLSVSPEMYLEKIYRLATLAEFLEGKGEERRGREFYRRARENLKKLLSVWKDRENLPYLYLALVKIDIKEGEWEEVEELLRKIQSLPLPASLEPLFYFYRGELRERAKDYEGAIGEYSRSLEKADALKERGLENILSILTQSPRKRKSSLILQSLAGGYSSSEIQFRIVRCYWKMGNMGKAREAYRVLREKYPSLVWIKKGKELIYPEEMGARSPLRGSSGEENPEIIHEGD